MHEIVRTTPARDWRAIAIAAAIAVAVAAAAWEWRCRAAGYRPGLDDTTDLWVESRRSVQPDSTVIIGSSRALFGLDLDELERGLGARPVQLCLVGSCVEPILSALARDPAFHGTVICDLVPGLLTVPPFAPPYQNALRALERERTQSPAQRWSHLLSLPLERTFACLQQDDLRLAALLQALPVPDRAGTQTGPALPPFFAEIDRDRRARMLDRIVDDQRLRERVKHGWIPLFTPPPKPRWIPDEAFGPFIQGMLDGRFAAMAAAVRAIRARGGAVVFLRMPSSGDLRAAEERLTPRAAVWDRLLRECAAPGIAAEDHPELSAFDLPEWSHLTAADSLLFTRRLLPRLQAAIAAAR